MNRDYAFGTPSAFGSHADESPGLCQPRAGMRNPFGIGMPGIGTMKGDKRTWNDEEIGAWVRQWLV